MAKIDEHIKVMMLKGETGANIKSIAKTATSGLVDTYAVTLTDGTESNFTVTNGRDGKDGAGFDTFEIGGRNLARNSAKLDIAPAKGNAFAGVYDTTTTATVEDRGDGFSAAHVTSSFSGIGVYANGFGLNPGDRLVFSATFESSGADLGIWFFAMCNDASGNRVNNTLYIDSSTVLSDSKDLGTVKDGESKRLSVAIKWSDEAKSIIDRGGSIELTFQSGPELVSSSGNSVSIYAPKLERSTKPSDWTPAPEDKADVSALASKADVSAIVPKASVESSTTASQAYAAGQYVVVNGILRKVKSAIAKGNTISDSNSTATTVTGELATLRESVSREAFEQKGVYAERFGNVVTLTIATSSVSISDNWGAAYVCVLPWQPTGEVVFAVTLQGGVSGVIGRVEQDGGLWIVGKDTEWRSGWLFGSASYVCA